MKPYQPLHDLLSAEAEPNVNLLSLCSQVATALSEDNGYRLHLDQTKQENLWKIILSHKIRPELSDIRHVMSYILHKAGWSYPRIGKELNRDHSSIIYGVNKVQGTPYLKRIGSQIRISKIQILPSGEEIEGLHNQYEQHRTALRKHLEKAVNVCKGKEATHAKRILEYLPKLDNYHFATYPSAALTHVLWISVLFKRCDNALLKPLSDHMKDASETVEDMVQLLWTLRQSEP